MPVGTERQRERRRRPLVFARDHLWALHERGGFVHQRPHADVQAQVSDDHDGAAVWRETRVHLHDDTTVQQDVCERVQR